MSTQDSVSQDTVLRPPRAEAGSFRKPMARLAKETLALIVICVPYCVATGLLIGIWGHFSPRASRWLIVPALDVMQTMPTFAYLIPMLLLFGVSPVSGLLATGLFAMPPMVS